MKRNTFKAFIWGAGIFGLLHLIICIYLIKIGGEACIAVFLMDFPLFKIGEKYFGRLFYADSYFYEFYFLFFGTLMYAFIGGIISSVLTKIIKLTFKIKI